MSSVSDPTMMLACPECLKKLRVPVSSAGKNGKCPACQTVFRIPAAQTTATVASQARVAQAPAAPQAPATVPPIDDDFYEFASSPSPTANSAPMTFPDLNAERPPKVKYPDPEEHDPVQSAKRGVDKGVLGGLAMMVIAVVWFFAGLQFLNRIFFYPPILFVIGLVAFVKGLATGNIAGGNKKYR